MPEKDDDLSKVIDDPDKKKEPDKKVPGEKLLLGKFKTEEEAVKSLQSLERKLTELAEDNKLLQSELDRSELERAGTRAKGREEEKEEDPFAFTSEEEDQLRTSPGKVLANRDKRLYQRILNDIRGVMSATQQVSRVEGTLRKQFYEDNPDLVGLEMIVGAVGQQVQAENPGVPAHRLLGKVSERAKALVAQIKDGKPKSPSGTHIEDDASRGGRPPKQTESQKELDATYKAQVGSALG